MWALDFEEDTFDLRRPLGCGVLLHEPVRFPSLCHPLGARQLLFDFLLLLNLLAEFLDLRLELLDAVMGDLVRGGRLALSEGLSARGTIDVATGRLNTASERVLGRT